MNIFEVGLYIWFIIGLHWMSTIWIIVAIFMIIISYLHDNYNYNYNKVVKK